MKQDPHIQARYATIDEIARERGMKPKQVRARLEACSNAGDSQPSAVRRLPGNVLVCRRDRVEALFSSSH